MEDDDGGKKKMASVRKINRIRLRHNFKFIGKVLFAQEMKIEKKRKF